MSLAPLHRYIGRIIHLIRKEKGMRQSELAMLTGLKQPNLSRIENGLVSPRQATLEKIAKALGVEVQVFYSENKVREVERKWAASLGPKHAALLISGKLVPMPLLDSSNGYPAQLASSGEPQGQTEVILQIPPMDGERESAQRFGVRIHGDSMQASGSAHDFKPGEIAAFSNGFDLKSGDFAFVMLRDGSTFRKVQFDGGDNVHLIPLNPAYQERVVPRSEIRDMWKLVRHIRKY